MIKDKICLHLMKIQFKLINKLVNYRYVIFKNFLTLNKNLIQFKTIN